MSSKTTKGKPPRRLTPTKSEPHEESDKAAGEGLVSKPPPAEIVDQLLGRVLSQTSEMKASISDAVRLLQLQRELGGEQLKKIEVQWVEPSDAEPASKE